MSSNGLSAEDRLARLAEAIERDVSDGAAELIFVNAAIQLHPVWNLPRFEGDLDLDQFPMHVTTGRGRFLGRWTKPQWKARMVGDNSPAFTRLTQDWVVATYSRWNHVHRPALGEFLADPPMVDLFGDLRWMRNDIVHHKGIAQAGEAVRCKLLGPFEAGDIVHLDLDGLTRVLDLLAEWVQDMGGTPWHPPGAAATHDE